MSTANKGPQGTTGMVTDLDDQDQNMNLKKKALLSTALKRTSEWIFSQEIPSDITIDVGGVSFSLHKFPLVSKCGLIRKLVAESGEADVAEIAIPGMPGGAEAFELAAKFCYGINFEIGTENIAMLRCAAEHLDMTEEHGVGNLVGRTEAYLNEVGLKSVAGAVSILHAAESLLPMAERVKLVGRCVDAIAYIAGKEAQLGSPLQAAAAAAPVVDWWAEDLTVLRIDMFQRVLVAMIARGIKQSSLGPVLMLYAQKSLRGLEVLGKGRRKMEAREEHEKRVVLETIVSLLPRERNAMSVSFLSTLVRAAMHLDTTVACRLDLERRMGAQLPQAALDDLLIPSYSFSGDTLFDVDTVHRILSNFLHDEPCRDLDRVGKLMENYLAEVASDRNLAVSKFIALAELVPEQSRVTEDGIYRAIDIYLKAHPVLSDLERKKVCSLMECQRLSREACAHAAQNDRLPVQTVVQVLYHEQQRLRDSVVNNNNNNNTHNNDNNNNNNRDSPDEVSTLRRENDGLKIELQKMKMKIRDVDISSSSSSVANSPQVPRAANGKPPPHPRRNSFISTVSKKLGRLYPFVRSEGSLLAPKARAKASKDRRHSIS